ncbi:hypothetical protein EDF63_3656 [Curtobacterium sp. JUb34]|uniref:hypothetical protein n=1 Tax=Curtobacterium sp. JUb34 TaxID=2485109 RepID=UPI000F487A4D|nr:hypothetical protein [Curtobacterium sp. JUb34]ROR28381.1 hypothetical protein EDF63_3656 [Curtobacterium sp. JUb34]
MQSTGQCTGLQSGDAVEPSRDPCATVREVASDPAEVPAERAGPEQVRERDLHRFGDDRAAGATGSQHRGGAIRGGTGTSRRSR